MWTAVELNFIYVLYHFIECCIHTKVERELYSYFVYINIRIAIECTAIHTANWRSSAINPIPCMKRGRDLFSIRTMYTGHLIHYLLFFCVHECTFWNPNFWITNHNKNVHVRKIHSSFFISNFAQRPSNLYNINHDKVDLNHPHLVSVNHFMPANIFVQSTAQHDIHGEHCCGLSTPSRKPQSNGTNILAEEKKKTQKTHFLDMSIVQA